MLKILSVFISIFIITQTFAQKPDSIFVNSDSLSFQKSLNDSTFVSDTTKGKKKRWDITSVINASASDSLIFLVKEKKMELYGSSEMKYKQTDLKAARIFVNFETNQISAEGVPDTSDHTGEKLMGTPVLVESKETYEGTKLTYNFKTLQGFISLAKNKSEGTYYGGEKVKKVDKDTYFVENGIYTTCTDDIPHYYFFAKEMKVIMKEQIIARWIWLYVGGVPFPIPLPFGAFPTQSGRRSGFIAPAYGESADKGWYLSHLGYFLALSDYMDVNATMDYYFQGGYNLNSRFRYVKRYSLNGSIDGGYSDLHTGEKGDPTYHSQRNWKFSLNHHQDIDPTMNLDANITFLSSKNYINNTSTDYNDLLSQDIQSRATLFKSWEESGNSLSLSYSRTQYLQTGNISEILPDLNFNVSQFYPFKSKGRIDPKDQKWYDLIGVKYSGHFQNERNKTSGNLNIRGGIQHSIQINASPKIGYFSISPSISYNEKWYNKRIEKYYQKFPSYDSTGNISGYYDSLVTNDVHQINMIRTFSFGVSASTRMFGIVQPNILGVEAIRHTITPSLSYNYHPDFSEPKWGYYGSYLDTNGRTVKYDKFSKGIFGGAGSGESQSINLTVGNLFEMKTKKDPTDTTSEAKKIQLLNLDASVGYDFTEDSLRLSNLSLGYRTQIGEFLSFAGGSNYSFYDYAYDKEGNAHQINKFLISQNKGLLKLTNFNFSISASLSGEKLKGKEGKKPNKQEEEENEEGSTFQGNNTGIYKEESPDFEIPWNIAVNYSYNLNKINRTKNSNISVNLNANLTKTWKLSFSTYYDIFNKRFQSPTISIYKDLHCWEMSINWNPIGVYRGYRFELRIKASQLQDIKIERNRGQYQGRGF